MGQKSHPIALRLQKTNRSFESLWYTKTQYQALLTHQLQVQNYLYALFQHLDLSPGTLSLILSAKRSRILLSYFDGKGSRQEKGFLSSQEKGMMSLSKTSPKSRFFHTTPFRNLKLTQQQSKKGEIQKSHSFFAFQNPVFFSQNLLFGSLQFVNPWESPNFLEFQKDQKNQGLPLELKEGAQSVQEWSGFFLSSQETVNGPISIPKKVQGPDSEKSIFFEKQRLVRLFLLFALFQKWNKGVSFSRISKILFDLILSPFSQGFRLSTYPQKNRDGAFLIDPVSGGDSLLGSTTSLFFLEKLIHSSLFRPCWLESWKALSESQSPIFLADSIAFLLEKRVSFRRVKSSVIRDLEENKNGRWSRVNGIRVVCSGRVGSSGGKKVQRARKEGFQWGETSLHVFSSKVDYCQKTALTGFGQIGVKVWICYK